MLNRQHPTRLQSPYIAPPSASVTVPPKGPLVYSRREYLPAIEAMGTTTSCRKTSNPDDYGPDD